MRTILFITFTLFALSLSAQKEATSSLERGDFMKFEIVNKSPRIIKAYVKGPKKSGGHFSYGLNLVPYVKRKENWTVGTKLYAVNSWGKEKLLYEFTAENEGQVVNVSPKKK